jgi:hypothetical protein
MKRLSALLLTLIAVGSSAQYLENESSPAGRPELFELRPRVGLGVGSFTFFGDVGGDQAGYSPLSSSLGYSLRISNQLSPYFSLNFESVFGQLAVNEINTDRRFNFRSEIRSGNVQLQYNFAHFLPKERFLEPWVSAGVGSFEFLSKSDMLDEEGRMYHYWDDGSIRDQAQNSPQASKAVKLRRDYTYETDLREMNADGLGKYQERSWSIPVSTGINFLMTERVHGSIGATMNFTFTDLIDNVSDAGNGIREGNSRKDNFMFAGFGLSYDLGVPVKERKPLPLDMPEEMGMPLALNWDDWDGDGVDDVNDKCAGTPAGAKVDSFGCPVDSDGDGFADYFDAEPNTPAGMETDPFGKGLSDELLELHYLAWSDSIPWSKYYGTDGFALDFGKRDPDPSRASFAPTYTVHLASASEGMSQEQINSLLAIEDMRTVTREDEEVFLAGSFEHLPEALKRKIELNQNGYNGEVRYDDGKKLSAVSENTITIEKNILESEESTAMPMSNDVIYRVQIGAFRYELSENIFSDVSDVMMIKGDDGIRRYMSGSFSEIGEAAKYKTEMLMDGFDGAFIIAYSGGKRITLSDAGHGVNPAAQDITYDIINESVNESLLSFSIQLGSFSREIPTEVLNMYLNLGSVKPRKGDDGMIKYLFGKFTNVESARKELEKIRGTVCPDAFIIGDFNGKMIPADDVQKLLGKSEDQVLHITK